MAVSRPQAHGGAAAHADDDADHDDDHDRRQTTERAVSSSTVSPRTKSLTASSLAEFSERARGPDDGCQPASHVGTTEGTLSVPDRSKRYWMF